MPVTPEEFEAQGLEMLEESGGTLVLEAARTPEAIERDGADKHLSAESIEYLCESARQWIMSRMHRKWSRGAGPTHRVEVEVTVRLDGEDAEAGTLRYILSPDGGHRREAL